MDNNLRHLKTDRTHSFKLAEIQFDKPQPLTPEQDYLYHEMQNASRFYEELTKDLVIYKNRLHRALQSTFPQIKQVSSSHAGQVYWHMVDLFPHAKFVLDSSYNQIFSQLVKIKGVGTARANQLTKEEAAERIEQISKMGESEGLDFKYSSTLNTNTMDAHRLAQWAKDQGDYDKAKKLNGLLFKAYFSDNLKLTDHQVLLDLAVEAGYDESKVRSLLDSKDDEQAVISDEVFIKQQGVHAVPFIIIDGKGYMGAQPREVFEKEIKDGLAKEK